MYVVEYQYLKRYDYDSEDNLCKLVLNHNVVACVGLVFFVALGHEVLAQSLYLGLVLVFKHADIAQVAKVGTQVYLQLLRKTIGRPCQATHLAYKKTGRKYGGVSTCLYHVAHVCLVILWHVYKLSIVN